MLAQPAILWARDAWRDHPTAPTGASGTLDDSSGHNAVPVAETWVSPAAIDLADSSGLRDLLVFARNRGPSVSVASARHRQGDQAL